MWFNPDLQTNIDTTNEEQKEQIELSKLAECMILWECESFQKSVTWTLDDLIKNLKGTPERELLSKNLNEFYSDQEEQVA